MKINEIFTSIWSFILFIIAASYEIIQKILSIIIKNIRILVRSKSSALVVIFGPLVIVTLVGLAFNSSTIYDVKIGVYSQNYSEVSENLIKQLQDDEYSIKKADTYDNCINGIKRGEFNICLIFSPGIDVTDNKPDKITFYVDYTRVNLVYAIMDNIASKLAKSTSKLSLEMTTTLVNQLDTTKDELAKRISSIAALGANNRNVATKINDITAKLATVNLTYNENDFKVDNIIASLNTARAVAIAQNKSTAEIENAAAKTNDLQKKLNWVVYQIKTAKEDIQKNSNDLSAVTPILDNDKKTIDDLQSTVTKVTQGIQSINVTTPENIVAPIQTEVQPIITEESYLSRLFPTFLVLVLMFVCIMLAVTLVLNEKTTNAHFRNFITPTNDFIFIIGTYLTALLIVFVQLAIIIYVVRYFLDAAVVSALSSSYLPLFLISTLFIFIGMIIGYLFNSQETAILAALFVTSICLFFSNTILPLEAVSTYLKWLSALNPFVLSEELIKKILIFNFSLSDVYNLIKELIKYIIVMLAAVYVSLKYYKSRLNE